MALNPHWDNIAAIIDNFNAIFPETSEGYLHLVFEDNNLDDKTLWEAIDSLDDGNEQQSGRKHCIEFFLRLLLDMQANGIDIEPGEED